MGVNQNEDKIRRESGKASPDVGESMKYLNHQRRSAFLQHGGKGKAEVSDELEIWY